MAWAVSVFDVAVPVAHVHELAIAERFGELHKKYVLTVLWLYVPSLDSDPNFGVGLDELDKTKLGVTRP